jgi:glycosyl transferase family 11
VSIAIGFPELEKAGRLGNQVIEIAATVGIAASRNAPVSLPPVWSYRQFFSCPDEWFEPAARIRSATRYADGLIEQQRHYLQGLWLFEHVADEIRDAFRPSDKAVQIMADHLRDTNQTHLRDVLAEPHSIALHIRHGDNTDPVTHPVGTWPLPTMDYYRAALDVLPDGPVVVFSDNIPWCEENLGRELGIPLHFVREGPQRPPEYEPENYAKGEPLDWVDMQIMTLAQHHITANSTYSWCGAWLAADPAAVWCNNWTGWRIPWVNPANLMPDGWIMVDNPVGIEHLVEHPEAEMHDPDEHGFRYGMKATDAV